MRGTRLQRFALFVAVSAVAGLLVAAVLAPVVGSVGLAARTGIDQFEQLPSELTVPPLPLRSRILAANGTPLATFYYENRVLVPLSQVAPVMRNAIIGIEDSRFYEHHGLDFKGIMRAALKNQAAGEVTQGGSTITQQYVKRALIESAPTEQGKSAAQAPTLARKIREARYAVSLEHRLTKDQILERYLNIAYFGDGAYGIGSAAQHYFGVSPARLTLAQSALLAGIVRSPTAYDPRLHPKAAKARRDVVLHRMLELHYAEPADVDKALQTPLGLHLRTQTNGCEASDAPFFCDYVVNEFLSNPAYGATREDRVKLLLRGGLTIHTTMDPTVQSAAQKAVADVPAKGPYGASEAVVQPGTGHIQAIAVNKPYGSDTAKGQTRVDYAADLAYGGSHGFQSGSTFKVFVLAAALQQGLPLGLTIYAPGQLRDLGGFVDCAGKDHVYPHVGNADPAEAGAYNLVTGTWYSVNTFYVQLERRTGLCDPAKLAESMGVMRADGGHLQQYPSMTLGTNEVSPLDMAGAYATFAAHGKYCPPTAITKVVAADNKAVAAPPVACKQVLDPGIADTVTSVLTGVLDKPGATAYGHAIGRPAAGKTGTVEDFTAAWFCGFTPRLAGAVWVGFPAGGRGHELTDVTIGGQYYHHVYGGTLPATIWQQTFTTALKGKPVEHFAGADPSVVRGQPVTVPDVRGLPPGTAEQQLQAAGLSPRLVAGAVPADTPANTVAFTDPPSGATAYPGAAVRVFVSNGTLPSPTASPSPSPAGSSPSPSPVPVEVSPSPSPSPTKKHGHH